MTSIIGVSVFVESIADVISRISRERFLFRVKCNFTTYGLAQNQKNSSFLKSVLSDTCDYWKYRFGASVQKVYEFPRQHA
jgi:hypothetical protein